MIDSTKVLILSEFVPKVEQWPVYGHAVEWCQGKWPGNMYMDELTQFERAVDQVKFLQDGLHKARSVASKIEKDLSALQRLWSWEECPPSNRGIQQ